MHGDCKGPVSGETACICDTVPPFIKTYLYLYFPLYFVSNLISEFSLLLPKISHQPISFSNQALSPGVVVGHLAEKLTARCGMDILNIWDVWNILNIWDVWIFRLFGMFGHL